MATLFKLSNITTRALVSHHIFRARVASQSLKTMEWVDIWAIIWLARVHLNNPWWVAASQTKVIKEASLVAVISTLQTAKDKSATIKSSVSAQAWSDWRATAQRYQGRMAKIDHEPSNSSEHKVLKCQLESAALVPSASMDQVDCRIHNSVFARSKVRKESIDRKQII